MSLVPKIIASHLKIKAGLFHLQHNGFWRFGRWFMGTLSAREGEALYNLVRELKPSVVVETGVQNGVSSWYTLAALDANKKGRLYSIDYPVWPHNFDDVPRNPFKPNNSVTATGRPPGWVVPQRLRSRWDKIRLGTSEDLLRPLLEDVGQVDLFIHDSDHSYENIMFELTTVDPFVRKGGVFLVDDFKRNDAAEVFARMNSYDFFVVDGFGVIRK